MNANTAKRFSLLVCMFGMVFSRAMAIETAGEVFVNLDALSLKLGDTVWANPGTYTDFEVFGNPIAGFIETTPAVIFDGASAFVGMDVAPAGLVGLDPTRSIEAWVFNESVASEETIVSWGKRGGPDGTNMSFNYGNHELFGAVGHWGGNNPDMGWIANPPDAVVGAPDAGQWHHLAYTYDEETARVYSDGVLWNEEDMTQFGGLDTHIDSAIAIASQWEADGVTLTTALKGTLAIGRLRIHDGVLSDAQIVANYNEEKDAFVNPSPPVAETIPFGPIHRYGFDNPETADATGAVISDSVGDAHGVVLGDGSSLTGSELRLNGGGSDVAAYVDLPNGIISSLTDVTVEGWATIEGAQVWGRLFDFGSTTDGELDEPGGGGEGQDYFVLTASRGDIINQQRMELRNNDPEHGGDEEGTVSGTAETLDTNLMTELDEEFHFAAIYKSKEDGGGDLFEYRNGELVGSQAVTIELGNLNDVNNWLGRSNWVADANFQGTFDEFRIFDYALTTNQILGNFQAGPDTINLGASGDVNGDGVCDAADIDALATAIRDGSQEPQFDLNGDGAVNSDDHRTLIQGEAFKNTWIGDANLDGEFSSGDLVFVFQQGMYETGGAATWAQGDWNGDGVVGSGDLVVAFQDGGFEQGPRGGVASVPEPSALVLLVSGMLLLGWRRRK